MQDSSDLRVQREKAEPINWDHRWHAGWAPRVLSAYDARQTATDPFSAERALDDLTYLFQRHCRRELKAFLLPIFAYQGEDEARKLAKVAIQRLADFAVSLASQINADPGIDVHTEVRKIFAQLHLIDEVPD